MLSRRQLQGFVRQRSGFFEPTQARTLATQKTLALEDPTKQFLMQPATTLALFTRRRICRFLRKQTSELGHVLRTQYYGRDLSQAATIDGRGFVAPNIVLFNEDVSVWREIAAVANTAVNHDRLTILREAGWIQFSGSLKMRSKFRSDFWWKIQLILKPNS
jgi:hypothetical protein